MSINILKRAELYNSTDPIGLPRKELNRPELKIIQGSTEGLVTVESLTYICFEADIKSPFYCKDFTLVVSDGASAASAYIKPDLYRDWVQVPISKTGIGYRIDFNQTLPDQAQLVYQLRIMYANLSAAPVYISLAELLTVDYPIYFDYTRFSVVASTRENSPIKVYNNSIQQSDKDIRVLPIFSDDYAEDSVYMLTASGKYDADRYHIQRGFRFPEDAPWESGRVSKRILSTVASGKICDGSLNTATTPSVYLTSNTTPSPYGAICNSNDTISYAYRPFTNPEDSLGWVPIDSAPAWVGMDFGSPRMINKCRIKVCPWQDRWPSSILIQGSIDSNLWDTLSTDPAVVYTDQWSPWYTFMGEFYRFYRIYIIETYGQPGANAEPLIYVITFVEAQNSPDPNATYLYADTLIQQDRILTISGTAVSGTWTSPVIYTPDPDFITMYVYGEDLTDDTYIGTDLRRVDSIVEARASDVPPAPNFLVSSWTPRLFTFEGSQDSLSLPARRPDFLSYQNIPDRLSSFWAPDRRGVCGGNAGVIYSRPYMQGKSKRMYVKGDGTILAQAPLETDESTMWEYAHRMYEMGIPIKEYGDINYFWNAGQFIPLMGSFIPYKTGACSLHHVASPTKWHSMVFATEEDSSRWATGKPVGDEVTKQTPYVYHFLGYQLGCANEDFTYEPLGSYTIAVGSHPNEWVSIMGVMYPYTVGSQKYMCLYYNHVRNFWAAEAKLIGIYGIGVFPCDEGWGVCKRKDGKGFWIHVGYNHRIIDKYDMDANLICSSRTNYGFNAIKETVDPAGIWGIRNDALYWYSENSDGALTEEFSITNSAFKYLQAGEVDDDNNLWVVDRDTSTVYRINFSDRVIDYEKEIPFTAAVWPHPRDGSAYLYTSFNSGTFSTAINKISVDDPYGYTELIVALPELPISDYSGVQFLGKAMESFAKPALHDAVWGTNDDISLEWQRYPNSSLALPGGKYKQFRITLNRPTGESPLPSLSKIRVPKSLVLNKVPYGSYGEVYINPHLRYNKKYGHFDTELVVWWPH